MVLGNEPFLCHSVDKVEDIQIEDPLRDILAERPILDKNNSTSRRILMLTSSDDLEANLVGIGLRNKGIDYVRLNIHDIPSQIKLSYSIGQDLDLAIQFTIQKKVLSLSGISVVWLRHFDIQEKNFGRDEPTRTFSIQQWNRAIEILQTNLCCKWINNPHATLQTYDRTRQLSVAKAAGFDIPDTLITNDPDAARDFYYAHDGEIVAKALGHHGIAVAGKIYSMFTRRIYEKDLSRFDDLIYAPCILQEQLSGRSELRVTVVGDNVFAAELDPRFTVKKCDDLHSTESTGFLIRVFELPDFIRSSCINLVKSLGLIYGAIDFVRECNDRLVFLEVNPTGDWYWIESKTKLSITRAMVNVLETLHNSEPL